MGLVGHVAVAAVVGGAAVRAGARAGRAGGRAARRQHRRLAGEPLRSFWLGVVLVGLGTALAAAAGSAGPESTLGARMFGWPALVLPLVVLGAAVRRAPAGSRCRADPVLLVLAGSLAVSVLARMHVVLGAVVLGAS